MLVKVFSIESLSTHLFDWFSVYLYNINIFYILYTQYLYLEGSSFDNYYNSIELYSVYATSSSAYTISNSHCYVKYFKLNFDKISFTSIISWGSFFSRILRFYVELNCISDAMNVRAKKWNAEKV